MKILILSNLGQGLYRFRRELIEKLCLENDVYISLPDNEYTSSFEKLGCQVRAIVFNRRGKNPFSDILLLSRYIKAIKMINPDVVLTYTIKPNIYGGLACKLTNKKYIANITGLGTAIENGGLMRFLTTSLYRVAVSSADCVFFQNKSNRDIFKALKIVKGKEMLIPGSGVNLEENRVETYPDDENGVRFLFVGRVMKDKGIEELLEATKKVYSKHKNIFLDIIGGCEENYVDFIANVEKQGYIKYHSFQKDVHKFIKDAHCTVLPSYHEGLANVLLESAATARPVIATRVPGCEETFEEGITGYGCEPKDVDSLANAMCAFVETSNKQRERMGKAGRAKMEKEFDRNIVVEAYMKALSEIEKTKGDAENVTL